MAGIGSEKERAKVRREDGLAHHDQFNRFDEHICVHGSGKIAVGTRSESGEQFGGPITICDNGNPLVGMPVSQQLDLTEGSVELVAGMDDEKQALTRFGFACA